MYTYTKYYDLTAGEVAGGSGLIGGLIDSIVAGHRQRDANNFQVGMYELQRKDALADRDAANAYNSPAEVMARYKAAGLNPNLIYGQGGTPSQTVRSSSPSSYTPAPATIGKAIAGAVPAYQDATQNSQAIANLTQQHQNLIDQDLNEQAKTVATQVGTDLMKTDIGMKNQQFAFNESDNPLNLTKDQLANQSKSQDITQSKSLFPGSMEMQQLKNQQIQTDVTNSINENDRQALKTAQGLYAGVLAIQQQRINQATSQIQQDEERQKYDLLTKNNTLQQLDINLKKQGLTWNDNLMLRTAGQILGPTNALQKASSGIKKFFGPEDTVPLTKDNQGTWRR